MQKLAAQLARRMPWLAKERHIGALAKLLHRHRLDADAGWSAERLLHALETHNRTNGQSVPDPARQRNSLGYLNWLLTAATEQLIALPITPAGVPRPVAAWRIEEAERRRQLAAEDSAAIAAAIAALRAQMNTAQSRASYSTSPDARRPTGAPRRRSLPRL